MERKEEREEISFPFFSLSRLCVWDETVLPGTGRKAQAGAHVPGKFLDFWEV